jgi:hypothetical protein
MKSDPIQSLIAKARRAPPEVKVKEEQLDLVDSGSGQ